MIDFYIQIAFHYQIITFSDDPISRMMKCWFSKPHNAPLYATQWSHFIKFCMQHYCCSLTLSLSLTTHSHTHTRYLSLSHTHTHTRHTIGMKGACDRQCMSMRNLPFYVSLSLSLFLSFSLSLSLSLPYTYTQTVCLF